MRVSTGLAGIAASVLVVGLAALPATWAQGAAADGTTIATTSGTTLYVQFNGPCNDHGPGTQAEPFCTVQAAANVVNPGQTVDITDASAEPSYQSVTITRSGTPAEPITFTWPGTGADPVLSPGEQTGKGVVTLKGVHDVTLSNLAIQSYGSGDGIDMIGASDISVNGGTITDYPWGITTVNGPAVSINGTSSAITISRTYFRGTPRYGVLSATGARQVTVTTSSFELSKGVALALQGTTGATLTSNTVFENGNCAAGEGTPTGIALADGTSGTVENNVLEAATSTCAAGADALSVDASSADSAGGVTADYNALVTVGAHSSEYSWAGNSYADPASFATATGQGTHDVSLPKPFFVGTPPEGSPALDSANCSASGELSTDINGAPRVRDPLATDASLGNGTCYADRGAYERQDSLPITYTTPPLNSAGYPAGAVPYTFGLTITSVVTSPWNEPVSYTVDFGDGSGATAATPGTAVAHEYTTAGQYTITITAADTSGSTAHSIYHVYALPDQPLKAALSAAPAGLHGSTGITPDMADFTSVLGSPTWEVASQTIAFGGNGASIGSADPSVDWSYIYAKPGTYTATTTVTDMLGRISTAKATITVGNELQMPIPRTSTATPSPRTR